VGASRGLGWADHGGKVPAQEARVTSRRGAVTATGRSARQFESR
jgi:hypothetical protein